MGNLNNNPSDAEADTKADERIEQIYSPPTSSTAVITPSPVTTPLPVTPIIGVTSWEREEGREYLLWSRINNGETEESIINPIDPEMWTGPISLPNISQEYWHRTVSVADGSNRQIKERTYTNPFAITDKFVKSSIEQEGGETVKAFLYKGHTIYDTYDPSP
tara:strand:- start:97 stop:582 length:486 start_codon:yes stop_codon:yes gene_type:complete